MSERALVVMVGKAGSGKTTQLKAYAAPCRRLLVADPEEEWDAGPDDVVIESAPRLLAHVDAIGALDPAVPFRIVYRDDADQLQLAAPAVAFAVRNVTLVFDELAWLCNAHYLPDWFRRVLQMGRKRRINLIGTTREPQEIHDMLLSQATLLHFFRVEPGNGLDRLRKRYPAIADRLPALPLHQSEVYGDPSCIRLFGREGKNGRA